LNAGIKVQVGEADCWCFSLVSVGQMCWFRISCLSGDPPWTALPTESLRRLTLYAAYNRKAHHARRAFQLVILCVFCAEALSRRTMQRQRDFGSQSPS
jgi:hypothetical protein